MQFAPDGRLFVCEQTGRLRIIKDGALLPTPFLTLAVSSVGERGLLGVAFDPNFATNKFVYVHYTATTPTVHNRISRVTANGDVAVAGSEVVIFELDDQSASNHNGGALAFGPDGKLYVGVGENAIGSNAQSFSNVLGKILRINSDGTIPADNPFYTSTSGRNRAIWAFGLRNPFSFAFNPAGPEFFINDVGQSDYEEVNHGRPGANYGWPTTEGPTTDSRFDSPEHAYANNSGACAVTGATFYAPAMMQFPAEYSGDYFFADYCGGWIRRLDPASGALATFASGIAAPVDLRVGPEGAFYYLARGNGATTGAVYRVAYGSAAPSITSHPTSQTVQVATTVTFYVGASGAPPLQYQWQRNGINVPGATASSFTLTSAITSDNGARFRALVSNGFGTTPSNEATLAVVSNRTPTGDILQPAAGTLYSAGNSFSFSGSATDPEDGSLPASAYTWRVDFHHDTHTHPFVPPTSGIKNGSFTISTSGETSANVWYRIYLTVRDSGGLTHTVQRDINPRVVRMTLSTNPSGLMVNLDGQPVTTPFSFDSVVGIERELHATSPQSWGGTPYGFVSWSDGLATRHTIASPAVATGYVASYAVASAKVANLAVAYDFEEESGTTLIDVSGNGHTGTISGATWTAGRIGGALSFDGLDDHVTIAAAPWLDLSTSGSVHAWVRLNTVGKWHALVAKGNSNSDPAHNYAMQIAPDGTVICTIGNGTAANVLQSTTKLATGVFVHIACTWDGAALRLYLDGALHRTVPQTIVPAGNTAPLFLGQFGGNVDRLSGVLDRVRLHSVALSQAQIQNELSGITLSDTMSPVRSNLEPTGTLTSGTSQATLRLTTNENSTCRYATTSGLAYDAMTSAFASSGGTGHSAVVSDLVGGAYAFYVRCKDAAGNSNTDDATIGFIVATGACPCTLWSSGVVPAVASHADSKPVELGVKFVAALDGAVTGLRFYKGPANTGIHVGNLWTAGGVKLSAATFVNETAEGWQEVRFPSPVPIVAGTVYVASYYSPVGGYARTTDYFTTTHTSGPLSAPSGGNGVYRYGTSGFPTATFGDSNYWVDVVFAVATPPAPLATAAYSFEEGSGTSSEDGSGNQHTATLSGATWTQSGAVGGALIFDGVDDFVTVAPSATLNLTIGTVTAWVKLDVLGRWQAVVAKGKANADTAHNYALQVGPDNRAICVLGNGSTSMIVQSAKPLTSQQFYHLGCTWDGSVVKLYIDGQLDREAPQTVAAGGNTAPLYIGQFGGNVDRLAGIIDEVRLYGVPLTAAELLAEIGMTPH